MIGKHLSHYLIESELGRGGMGIVYRAKDTKLDRTVAIKVLPVAALASGDDRARFYREAKAAAAEPVAGSSTMPCPGANMRAWNWLVWCTVSRQ